MAGALSGYEIVSDASPIDSNVIKTAAATCPAGKQLIGGGGRLVGSTAGVALDSSAPPFFSSAAEWSATAHELVSTSGNWGVEADAICGVVDAYEMVVVTNGPNSGTPKFQIASCPGGKQVLGGGVRLLGVVNGTAIQSSRPHPDGSTSPNGWYGDAEEIVSNPDSWTLVVYAMCGTVSDYEVVYDDTVGADSTSPKSLDVSGSPGKLLTGGGSRLYAAFTGNVALTASFPDVSGGGDPLAWEGAGAEILSTNNSWGLEVSAIYAPEPTGGLGMVAGAVLLGALKRRRAGSDGTPPRGQGHVARVWAAH